MFTDTVPGWDNEFAMITIRYKSGKSYVTPTTVSDARKRALTAINRRSASWIKVTIPDPNPNSNKIRQAVWTITTKWKVEIITVPPTKN